MIATEMIAERRRPLRVSHVPCLVNYPAFFILRFQYMWRVRLPICNKTLVAVEDLTWLWLIILTAVQYVLHSDGGAAGRDFSCSSICVPTENFILLIRLFCQGLRMDRYTMPYLLFRSICEISSIVRFIPSVLKTRGPGQVTGRHAEVVGCIIYPIILISSYPPDSWLCLQHGSPHYFHLDRLYLRCFRMRILLSRAAREDHDLTKILFRGFSWSRGDDACLLLSERYRDTILT